MSLGGGASFPLLPAAEIIATSAIRVFDSITSVDITAPGTWRPPQWSKPALTTVTVPAPYVQAPSATAPSAIVPGGPSNAFGDLPADNGGTFTMSVSSAPPPPPNASPIVYVFDAILRVGHSQPAQPTRNPIQTGSNTTDHVLLMPARVTLDIGMSDAMDSYTPGQWSGLKSKSVNAFQVLDNLRLSRIPLTITTRLKTYFNMIIVDIPVDDSYRTLHGLRTPVVFEQIFVATIGTMATSARPQTTDSTALGGTLPTPPTAGMIANNMLPSTTSGIPSPDAIQQQLGTVPGAGTWSSNPTSALPAADFVPES